MTAQMKDEMRTWNSLMRFASERPQRLPKHPLPPLLLQSCLGSLPLHFAVLNNNLEMALLLLDHKVDPNAFNHFGETPLHWASFKGYTAMIQLLLAAKANIEQADYDSETPLHWSVHGDRWKATQLLLQLGASITSENKDSLTPVQLARQQESWRCWYELPSSEGRERSSPFIHHLRSFSSPIPSSGAKPC